MDVKRQKKNNRTILKIICIEFWKNPKEALLLIKMIIGGIIIGLLGCFGIGFHECGKKVLDKLKPK